MQNIFQSDVPLGPGPVGPPGPGGPGGPLNFTFLTNQNLLKKKFITSTITYRVVL
jgi:hypothetical protein